MPVLLNSVDLFTGIGGFVLGLEGICKPILYCDNDPRVLHALEEMMSTKRLPIARVVDDVEKLSEIVTAVGRQRVDVITAGSPCVGFSGFGKRAGLQNPHSALFFAAVRVAEALKPPLVVFENVASILSLDRGRDFRAIVAAMDKAGYDCRWTVASASDVGLPQVRRRWFCMCVRRGAQKHLAKLGVSERLVAPEPLSRKRAPLPLIKRPATGLVGLHARYHMLGNAIVPAVAHLAFIRLFTAFAPPIIGNGRIKFAETTGGRVVETTSSLKPVASREPQLSHGYSCGTGGPKAPEMFRKTVEPVPPSKRKFRIVVDPTHFRAPKDAREYTGPRAPAVLHKVVLSTWPTPRAGARGHCNVLSERAIRDVSSVAMFCSEWEGVKMPRPTKHHVTSPEFLEWLMGFPLGHTRVDAIAKMATSGCPRKVANE
jgi:site-specific DNA-cytosine methylase